jgi:hypothetical protein
VSVPDRQGTSASGRYEAFAKRSASDRFLRKPDIADRGLGRRKWAVSCPSQGCQGTAGLDGEVDLGPADGDAAPKAAIEACGNGRFLW